MNFNTLLFPVFFAVCAAICWITPTRLRPYWLLLASYGYYCYQPANRQLVFFLLFATLVSWLAGILLRSKHSAVRRAVLWGSILLCLSPLVVFKQYSFFYQLVHSTRPDKLLYPLGISYFTFQSLGYVIDRYRRKYPAEKNLLHYALYVSFFPCIFTGPIERYDHLMPQLKARPAFHYNDVAGGAFRMLWGYCKKMVLADHLAVFVLSYYSGSAKGASGPMAAAAAVCFALQLYLDFSGCCDMAIGGARMMGFHLKENFNNPFLATSYADLWRRWHMSLTGWFRDYVYISLGGNRKGLPRWALNTLIVFGVSGIWHGLDWGYLLWGLACGALLVVEQLPAKLRKQKAAAVPAPVPAAVGAPAEVAASAAPAPEAPPHARHARHAARLQTGPSALCMVWLRRILVFTEFSLCFILFAQALYTSGNSAAGFSILFTGWNAAGFAALSSAWQAAQLTGAVSVVLMAGIFIVFAVESRGDVAQWIRRRNFAVRWVLYYVLLLTILFFGVFGKSDFIYQNY